MAAQADFCRIRQLEVQRTSERERQKACPRPRRVKIRHMDMVPEIVMENPLNRGTIYGRFFSYAGEGRKKEVCTEDDIDWIELGERRNMIDRFITRTSNFCDGAVARDRQTDPHHWC